MSPSSPHGEILFLHLQQALNHLLVIEGRDPNSRFVQGNITSCRQRVEKALALANTPVDGLNEAAMEGEHTREDGMPLPRIAAMRAIDFEIGGLSPVEREQLTQALAAGPIGAASMALSLACDIPLLLTAIAYENDLLGEDFSTLLTDLRHVIDGLGALKAQLQKGQPK